MKTYFTIIAILMTGTYAMAQDTAESLETIYQKFTFTLFDKVVGEEQKSVILSPLSAQIALSMVQNGAAGNTLTEIQQAMGTDAYTNEQVNEYNQQLAERLFYRPPFSYDPEKESEEDARESYEAAYPICESGNGLWSAAGLHLLDNFKQQLKNFYDAEVGEVDFGTQEGIDVINDWVNEKTHHLIPSILNNPNSEILTLLANSLYFKGSWAAPFNTDLTQPGKFYLTDGSTTDVEMMTADIIYTHTTLSEKFCTITLPYGTGDFSMTIFLPTDAQGMPSLTYEDWVTATDKNAPKKEMMLKMPKFEIEGNYDLVDIFQSLGMEEAFTASADFSRMSDLGFFIDDIIQSGKIIVDEKGTEAAAVTAVMMMTSAPTEIFVIDRPFYFTLENQSTHTILFVGRMMDISKPAGSPDGIGETPVRHKANHQLYDLSGRALQLAPAKGMYILDGKKYLI